MSLLLRTALAGSFSGVRLWHVLLFLPWFILLAWTAAESWFLCDDAFVSFRYARNLLEGHGLVFNRGEYVEGYSNFLWTLELAALWGVFGLRPEHAAPWLSAACTAATLAAILWWMRRLPELKQRKLTAWMALGLLCSSATFAVWTSGGGLETRQFTLFVVLAVVCLSLYRSSRRGLTAASLSLAAAALTRPEGLLIAACCFAWFAAQRMADAGKLRLDWPGLLRLALPFAVLVGAHFLFRYAYYGEWLPNTYYAKHIRPWYEMGFVYLWMAALETGLYLLLPLAWAGMRARWRESRDGIYALPLLLAGTHMAYVARIGGDHFEYRPLDFYWPLLAPAAASGVAHMGAGIAEGARRFAAPLAAMGARTWALILFLPVLFYCSAVQGILLAEGNKVRERIVKMRIELDAENMGFLAAVPGMPMLAAISNSLRQQAVAQFTGISHAEHREYAKFLLPRFTPYQGMKRGIIPEDAVTLNSARILAYYVDNLTFIDKHGIIDAAIARMPVTTPNHERQNSHDRWPTAEYIEQRGVNFTLHPAALSAEDALSQAQYAIEAGPGLWMPFDSPDQSWVLERFSGRDLRMRPNFSNDSPHAELIFTAQGGILVGERFLWRFEDGFDGWRLEGDAVTNHAEHEEYNGQQSIHGNIGSGFLTSFHPDKGDGAVGSALSPEFRAAAGQHLVFLIAGGKGEGVGARLLADGKEVAVWRGENTERFAPVVHNLEAVAGKRLQIELFDRERGGWGHIMLDHALLMRLQEDGRT